MPSGVISEMVEKTFPNGEIFKTVKFSWLFCHTCTCFIFHNFFWGGGGGGGGGGWKVILRKMRKLPPHENFNVYSSNLRRILILSFHFRKRRRKRRRFLRNWMPWETWWKTRWNRRRRVDLPDERKNGTGMLSRKGTNSNNLFMGKRAVIYICTVKCLIVPPSKKEEHMHCEEGRAYCFADFCISMYHILCNL